MKSKNKKIYDEEPLEEDKKGLFDDEDIEGNPESGDSIPEETYDEF